RLDCGRARRDYPVRHRRAADARRCSALRHVLGERPSMKPALSILCSALALLGACSDPKFDEASQTGPNPLLPDPKQFLIPPINVAPGEGWPAGKTPVVPAGLQIKALVQ